MIFSSIHFYFAASCQGGSLLGFPTWYHYLNGQTVNGICSPVISNLSDVWLIVAAVIEILLRIAALIAVGYTIWGGFLYITSQGEPNKTAEAKDTIIDALAGLTISITAAAVVGFIAARLS